MKHVGLLTLVVENAFAPQHFNAVLLFTLPNQLSDEKLHFLPVEGLFYLKVDRLDGINNLVTELVGALDPLELPLLPFLNQEFQRCLGVSSFFNLCVLVDVANAFANVRKEIVFFVAK